MEEMLGNVPGCRQVFERWMEWEPDEQAWFSFIKMELRYKEINRARAIYERFVMVHPEVKNWIKFAKFEEHQGTIGKLNDVYLRSMCHRIQQTEGSKRVDTALPTDGLHSHANKLCPIIG